MSRRHGTAIPIWAVRFARRPPMYHIQEIPRTVPKDMVQPIIDANMLLTPNKALKNPSHEWAFSASKPGEALMTQSEYLNHWKIHFGH
jgi:hypothetical protein